MPFDILNVSFIEIFQLLINCVRILLRKSLAFNLFFESRYQNIGPNSAILVRKNIDFNKTVVFLGRSIICLIDGVINRLNLNQFIANSIINKEVRFLIVPDSNGLEAQIALKIRVLRQYLESS